MEEKKSQKIELPYYLRINFIGAGTYSFDYADG
jgi:hypothetical protein